jgi:hypothetical protein
VVQRGGAAGGCTGIAWVGSRDDFLYRLRELNGSGCRLVPRRLRGQYGWADRLGRLQGDDRDFRGTVQAEGETHGADTTVDVELHSIEAVVPFRVLFPVWRQDKRAQKGQTNLAAVGVA